MSDAINHLPQEIIALMSDKAMRLHHYLWHQTRNSWHKYPKEVQVKLKKLGWEPIRPYRDGDDQIIFGNNAGEDFLYMHRQMIRLVNLKLQEVTGNKFARIYGWSVLPRPDDPFFPVPPSYEHATLNWLNQIIIETKSDYYFQTKMIYWEKLYQDPSFLQSISLGDLGSMLESTIHDAMHMRWSTNPVEFRPDPLCTPEENDDNLCSIDDKWNLDSYNFLGDEYSSHVNPIFWKIHGWVDDRISDWMIANKVKVGWHTDMVDPDWIGTWTGPIINHLVREKNEHDEKSDHGEHDHDHSGHNVHNMLHAIDAIHRCGVIHHFYSVNH